MKEIVSAGDKRPEQRPGHWVQGMTCPWLTCPRGREKKMGQWEYQITFHELPQRSPEEGEKIIKCDQAGQCLVHDTFGTGVRWLEDLFRDQGQKGWELVQAGYHHRELLCIWKRTKGAGK